MDSGQHDLAPQGHDSKLTMGCDDADSATPIASPPEDTTDELSDSLKQKVTKQWVTQRAHAFFKANHGRKRPFGVGREQLVAAAEQAFGEGREERMERIRSIVHDLVDGSPVMLCTLAACDLSLPAARSLLFAILQQHHEPEGGAGEIMRPDFLTTTLKFCQAGVASKRSTDKSPLYLTEVTWGDGRTARLAFCNQATYVAYRYFLGYMWSGFADVPSSWTERGFPSLYAWIRAMAKSKDRSTTFLEFNAMRDALACGRTAPEPRGMRAFQHPHGFESPSAIAGREYEAREALLSAHARQVAVPMGVIRAAPFVAANGANWPCVYYPAQIEGSATGPLQ